MYIYASHGKSRQVNALGDTSVYNRHDTYGVVYVCPCNVLRVVPVEKANAYLYIYINICMQHHTCNSLQLTATRCNTLQRTATHCNRPCPLRCSDRESGTYWLQCVAVRRSVLLFVAVRWSALQYVAVHCSTLQCVGVRWSALQCVAVCGSVLQCVAVWCRALQGVAVRCSALQCVAVCCSALQCVAACCSVLLQCVAVCCSVLQYISPWPLHYPIQESGT